MPFLIALAITWLLVLLFGDVFDPRD